MSTTLFLANVMQNVVRKPEYDPAVKAICMAAAASAATDGKTGRMLWGPWQDEALMAWFPDHLDEIDEAYRVLDETIGITEVMEVAR